jgi:hypothetical protein
LTECDDAQELDLHLIRLIAPSVANLEIHMDQSALHQA